MGGGGGEEEVLAGGRKKAFNAKRSSRLRQRARWLSAACLCVSALLKHTHTQTHVREYIYKIKILFLLLRFSLLLSARVIFCPAVERLLCLLKALWQSIQEKQIPPRVCFVFFQNVKPYRENNKRENTFRWLIKEREREGKREAEKWEWRGREIKEGKRKRPE